MKELTRGTAVTQKGLERFIKSLGLPAEDEGRLLALTPASYVGRSAELVEYLER
jgi:adenylosuccinate lyase